MLRQEKGRYVVAAFPPSCMHAKEKNWEFGHVARSSQGPSAEVMVKKGTTAQLLRKVPVWIGAHPTRGTLLKTKFAI